MGVAKKKRGPGRPKRDDPPKMLATTIPESLYDAFRAFAKASDRPQSEHLADALRAYLKKHTRNTSRSNS